MFLIVCKNCGEAIANFTAITSVVEDQVISESYCEKCYKAKHDFRIRPVSDGKYRLEILEGGKVTKKYDLL